MIPFDNSDLPPLSGDDSLFRRLGRLGRRNRCQTDGCEHLTESGEKFCGDCLRLRFVGWVNQGDEIIERWPMRPAAAELPTIDRSQPHAAPLIGGAQLDLRCWWCCAILNEDTIKGGVEPGHPSGQDRRSPAIEPLVEGYACPAHSDRYHALMATIQRIDWFLNTQHMTSRQIEQIYAYGYLGTLTERSQRHLRGDLDESA